MGKITPFLWFDDRVEEALSFYASVFPNTKVVSMSRAGDGKVMSASFEIEGQELMALNGGPQFKFTEAISLFVKCETQGEVDYYWNRLTEDGGEESRCGWLKDRFGLSWQIIPNALGKYLSDKDPQKARRAMQAMLQMKKIDIAALEKANAG